MALVVEDGTGLENADSYVDVAFADAYVAAYVASTDAWDELDEPTKEKKLREAAAWLDGTFGAQFVGIRGSQTQGLEWPRCGAVDVDGFPVEGVPLAVKRAQVEAAAVAAANPTDSLTPQASAGGATLIKSETKVLGPLEKSVEYAGEGKLDAGSTVAQKGAATPAQKKASQLLRRLLQNRSRVYRG
jgi:hypothetical protein